jgi:hypothetical protein
MGLLADMQFYLLAALAMPTLLYVGVYVLTNLYIAYAGPQNLKKKYSATWALVTGAGTGIGSKCSPSYTAYSNQGCCE